MSQKKLGVYVEGKLKLQSRDIEKCYQFARLLMNSGAQVWVTPIGSFVNV